MSWYKIAQSKKCTGWLAVRLNKTIANKIQRWGKEHISEDIIYKKDGHGREEDTHVTLAYGLCVDEPEIIKSLLKNIKGPIRATINKITFFKPSDDFHVVILKIDSPDLIKINKSIVKTFNITSDFDEYKPHCTVAYVKPGEANKYAGDTVFYGTKLEFNNIVFVNNKDEETIIKL